MAGPDHALRARAVTIALRARLPGDLIVGITCTTIFATIVELADRLSSRSPAGARWPDVAASTALSLVGEFSFDSSRPGVSRRSSGSPSSWPTSSTRWGRSSASASQAGYLDERGEIPEIRKPLLVDSLAALAGGAASASSATTYIESAAGVGVGGRTGWVSVVTGALFFPFMFLAPLIGMVPPQATAPALIIVGWLMISVLTEAEEGAEGAGSAPPGEARRHRLPRLRARPLGGARDHVHAVHLLDHRRHRAGFIAYVLIRISQGEAARVHPLMYASAAAFTLYFLVPLLQEFDWI